ncbi:MAG: PAS domain-containing protein, partial [Acidobacteria bacterium]|nr:PAS domain-containing protein [Acidobacteriota bacterium]
GGRTALEAALQEEKEQRAAMETSLKEAEERRRQQNEILDTERAGWEQSRQELEQRVREVEAQRAAVQAILRETEEKQAALETLLQEAEESRKQQAEVFDAERSRWEQSRQEWDEKLREAGEQHAANLQSTVRDMEDRYNRICEENQAKESQLEEIGRELQQLKEDIENLQSALSEEKLRYQKVSQISSVGVVITTLEGRVLECNDSAARLFGYAGAEDALSQADDESNFRIFTYQGTLGERLRREGRLENIEWSSLSLDGRLIRLREDALLLEDSEGDNPRIERVLTDITQVYRLSEEIRRIRKVESTGDLLAAAVKNLKNICESLADSSKLLKENPDDGNTIQQVAEKLLKDADRGAKNVRQFLSVSAKTDRVPAVVNMNEILADNDPVLRSLVGENIDLQIHSLSDRSLITADRQETVQLISNLVLSSMKTLPLGGTVSIETENIEVDASTSEHPDNLPSGTFVLVTISADGCDVLPERRMSYNKSIMDRIGGWISTTNDPQTGNVHRLYFPRVESFAGRTTLASDGTGTESSE